MQNIDYKNLNFRRQYILSNASGESPFNHYSVNLPNNYRLDYHKDLVFTKVKNENTILILLGDVYDYKELEKSNQEILKECSLQPLPDLLNHFCMLAGRYVVILYNLDSIWIFNDASAYRKIYYTNRNGNLICSSSQHLLAQSCDIRPSEDPLAFEYYNADHPKFLNKDIGDLTRYDGIKQILPNHYLEINTGEIVRFWPQPIQIKTSEEIVEESANMIKGFIHAASNRYQLMIPVTSGIDSRLLLAASRELSDKVVYYLNDSDQLTKSADYLVPKKMLSTLGLELHLLHPAVKADDKFRKIYFNNNPFADIAFPDIMLNYYINFPDRLNLPGNTLPVVKAAYHSFARKIDEHALASLYGNSQYEFALRFYRDWINKLDGVCERTNSNIYDLLFLEDYVCNWQVIVQLDKDIGQEEFVPFNSAYLISLMLSYEKSRRQEPAYGIHKDIIKFLWPELLRYPINPSFTSTIKNILGRLNLYNPALRLKRFLFGK